MDKRLRIGIVGTGAIGSSLAKIIIKDFSGHAKLAGIYDIDLGKARILSQKLKKTYLAVLSLDELIRKSELIIEAASAKSSWNIAKIVLAKSKDIMIMSVGGVVDHSHELCRLASKNNSKVYIPSGAISGIDALKAAQVYRIKKVTLTTTKNPLAFKGVKYIEDKKINLRRLKKDKILFSGFASKAVKLFPQNINVAAVLSLAGIGKNKTLVKIIASPKVNKNIHEILIESKAGTIKTRTENILHPENPKTSFLAVLSAVAMIKGILEPVRIGT